MDIETKPRPVYPPKAPVPQLTLVEVRALDPSSVSRARAGGALVSVMAGVSDEDILKERT